MVKRLKELKVLDWDYAPKAAYAYEKVGSKQFWHLRLSNDERKTVTAPLFDTGGHRIVWLYGDGIMSHPEIVAIVGKEACEYD